MMNDTTNVDFHIDVSDQNHQHQHQDAHSQEEMTQEIIMGQQQQQNQKQQSSQTSTPKGTLQSNEEYQRWKGGWRKVIKKTDVVVAVTPLMSNGENGGRKQINASSAITSRNDSNQQQQQHYDGQWQTMTHQEQYQQQQHQQQQQEDDTEDEDEGVFITTANNNNKNMVPGETSFLSEISTSVSPSRRYHHDLNHIGMHSMNAVGSHSPGGRSGVSSSVANHPGLRFHPTGSCASTDDDDDDVDYNNEGDERVVKMLRCATAAAAVEISTPASSRRNVKEKKQQSQSLPQSIMEDGTTLTSFSDARVESKWSSKKKMGRNKSSSAATADTSCATSVMTGEDEDDYSNYSFVRNRIHVGKISSDKRVGSNSNREDEEEADVNTRKSNVVGNLLIAPLKVFHEFIIENGCCSSGGKELIEKTCNGNSGNVDDDVYSHHTHDGGYDSEHGEEISFEYDDEMTEGGDDDGNGSFVLSRRHRNHRGRTESISEASSSLHYTTDDDSLSRASSKSSRSYKKQGHKKYSTVNTKVAATKAVVVSPEERRSRRGRSLTARQGYNSGNEKHRYLSHSKDAISSSCSYHSDSDRIVGSRRKVKTHNKIQDDDDESINELINDAMGSDDDSAGSTGQESSHQSVAESALSQDHSTWMEMLDVSPQRTDNNIHRRPKSVKKEDPIVDVKASVAAPVVNRSPSLVDTFFKVR